MKKLITLIALCLIGIGAYSQKIGNLDVSVSAPANSRILVNDDPSGNKLESITKSNFLSDVDDYFTGENLSDFVPLLTDTIPGFTFGDGRGVAADTTGLYLDQDLGALYVTGSDTLYLLDMAGGVKTSKNAPSVYVNIYWDANLWDATPADSAWDAATNINSTTGGTKVTSFDRYKVPPGYWCWVGIARTPVLGTKPAAIRGSVGIYKLRGHGR